MYMANARDLRLGPNTTYIPLARVGVLRWVTGKNLRHPTQNIPTCWYILCWVTQHSGVWCIAQRQPPTPGIVRRSGI